jgi:hypothetical protein
MMVGMRYRPARDASMKPIVALVLAGIIGGAGGFLLALATLRPEPFPDSSVSMKTMRSARSRRSWKPLASHASCSRMEYVYHA